MIPKLSDIFVIREAQDPDEDDINIDAYHLNTHLSAVPGWNPEVLRQLIDASRRGDQQASRLASNQIHGTIQKIRAPRSKATAESDFQHLLQTLARIASRSARRY